MATVNTRVVRRTNALLGHPYGENFRYLESTMTGKGITGRLKAIASGFALKLFMVASVIPFLRKHALLRRLPKPGEGPSREQRENGYFNLLLLGNAPDGDMLRLRIKGDRDPGYGSTSKMIAETAICLARGESTAAGGIWTPASAMGSGLRERLESNAGLSFEFE